MLNTFPVLENLHVYPPADRLLLNMLSLAAGFVAAPLSELPPGFGAQIKAIGYSP